MNGLRPGRLGQPASAIFTVVLATCQVIPSMAAAQLDEGRGVALRLPDQRYELRPGDILGLDFPYVPEFNQAVTVQPDGYITLRVVGDVPAEGKTLPELREALRGHYATILREPAFTLGLENFELPSFIAGGHVGAPGKYELRSDTTVSQAVAIAGGFRSDALHSQVLLFRRTADGQTEVRELNVKEMLARDELLEDVYLLPGDMVWVPQNFISKIERFLPGLSFSPYFNPF